MIIIVVAAVAAYGAYTLGGGGVKTETGSNTQSGTNTGSSSTATTSSSPSTSATGLGSGEISVSDAMGLMRAQLAGASVSQSTDSITFSSPTVSITAFAIMPGNATSIMGMRPPSYSQGDVFVMGGMIDPTLYIQSGASVKFTVVNMDNGMCHDLVVSTVAPPYPSSMAQYMMFGGYGTGMMGSGYQGFLYMMSVLSPANYASGWAQAYSYTVTVPNDANLWYLCTYPGHAESGMYGEIVTT
jgi:rusticyanin